MCKKHGYLKRIPKRNHNNDMQIYDEPKKIKM